MNETTLGPWRQLRPRVFVATCPAENVNIGLVVGDDAALLVDTGSTPEQGAAILAAANQQAGVWVRQVVITHNHFDHWFGLAGMAGIDSIAQENLLNTEPTAATSDFAASIGLASLPQPNSSFAMAKAIQLGGVRVELLHFGPAHTNCDTLVVVPEQNVIFTGDLLEESGDPQFDASSDPKNWPVVLDGMLGSSDQDTLFVPGHGQVVDRDYAFRQRAELGMLYSNTEYLIGQGVQLADAATADQWPFSAETLASALPLIYAELAAKGVKPRTQLPLV